MDHAPIPNAAPIPAHYSSLEAVENAAWEFLALGATSRKSAFHQATVANIGIDGRVSPRTVVLRGADRAARRLRFHTDVRSTKVAALKADPRCAMHFYDHDEKVQVRADGLAIVHHEDERTAHTWEGMRDFSKECYRQPIAPGAVMQAPDEANRSLLCDKDGYGNFVLVEVEISAFEWLYLAAAGHRRALVRYGATVDRDWLAP
ncbi:MAG: pyridoxamine 5'-phosphate oxidase family protein [Pseudomonadota bacterium]